MLSKSLKPVGPLDGWDVVDVHRRVALQGSSVCGSQEMATWEGLGGAWGGIVVELLGTSNLVSLATDVLDTAICPSSPTD